MARPGRKQLAVLIKEEIFARFEEIKEETGLSNAKLIEMLIENYNANTNTNTNTKPVLTEERVAEMIQAALANTKTKTKPKKEKEPIIKDHKETIPALVPETEPDLNEDNDYLFHIIPKTAKVGKPETSMRQYHDGSLSWIVLEGCRQHFDKNGKPIPFRVTYEDGTVPKPDLDELNEMRKYYGKPIEME